MIWHAYLVDGVGVQRATDLLVQVRSSPILELSVDVNANALWLRADFDRLLAYFGMMEVACLSGYIERQALSAEHMEFARLVLMDPNVRRYYEHERPLVLPRLHRMRLEGKHLYPGDADAERGAMLFDEFFTLSQPRRDGGAVETFLAMLEGKTVGGLAFSDMLGALKDPAEFLVHSTFRPEDRADGKLEPVSAAIQGFLACSELAPSLLGVIEEARGLPFLQAAMWHHHSHWLRLLNGATWSEVERAFRALDSWQSEPTEDEREAWEERRADGNHARAKQEVALTQLRCTQHVQAFAALADRLASFVTTLPRTLPGAGSGRVTLTMDIDTSQFIQLVDPKEEEGEGPAHAASAVPS